MFRHCISFDYGGTSGCTGFEEKTYGFDVTFTPTQLGPTNNCFVIVQLKGGDSRTIGVSGVGIKPLHDASFSTDKLDFGEQVQAIHSDACHQEVLHRRQQQCRVHARSGATPAS